MATPHVTPQVVPLSQALLAPPTSLSPIRIFVSCVVLLVFLLVALRRKSESGRRLNRPHGSGARGSTTILLVGPLASGKTSLFSSLLYGSTPATHTSMKENEGVVKVKWPTADSGKSELEKSELVVANEPVPLSTPVHLVDLPGHARLRTRALAQFVPAADGVVFVIDGQSGLSGKTIRDAGEHLHVLLSLLSLLQSSRPSAPSLPVLILLSKSDLSASSAASTTVTLDRAKQALARELERRRVASISSSRSAGARLEGLEAIPAAPSSGGASSWFAGILSAFGIGSSNSTSALLDTSSRSSVGLPSDEAEILSSGEAFPFEGAFEWDKLAQSGVCEINWATGSAKKGDSDGLWRWVEGLP